MWYLIEKIHRLPSSIYLGKFHDRFRSLCPSRRAWIIVERLFTVVQSDAGFSACWICNRKRQWFFKYDKLHAWLYGDISRDIRAFEDF